MKGLLAAAAVVSLFAAGCSGQEGETGARHPDADPSTGEGADRHTTIAEFAVEETTQGERTLPETGGPR